MPEKRHKINKLASYQKMIVRNSPAFDRHGFVASQKLLTFFIIIIIFFFFFPWSAQKSADKTLDRSASCESVVWIDFI